MHDWCLLLYPMIGIFYMPLLWSLYTQHQEEASFESCLPGPHYESNHPLYLRHLPPCHLLHCLSFVPYHQDHHSPLTPLHKCQHAALLFALEPRILLHGIFLHFVTPLKLATHATTDPHLRPQITSINDKTHVAKPHNGPAKVQRL